MLWVCGYYYENERSSVASKTVLYCTFAPGVKVSDTTFTPANFTRLVPGLFVDKAYLKKLFVSGRPPDPA